MDLGSEEETPDIIMPMTLERKNDIVDNMTMDYDNLIADRLKEIGLLSPPTISSISRAQEKV